MGYVTINYEMIIIFHWHLVTSHLSINSFLSFKLNFFSFLSQLLTIFHINASLPPHFHHFWKDKVSSKNWLRGWKFFRLIQFIKLACKNARNHSHILY
jgi:hypothetical protein